MPVKGKTAVLRLWPLWGTGATYDDHLTLIWKRVNEPQRRYALLWLTAMAWPKSTEVPHYPHNYLAIPMFVHRIALPLAIHWQQSFVQNMAKVVLKYITVSPGNMTRTRSFMWSTMSLRGHRMALDDTQTASSWLMSWQIAPHHAALMSLHDVQ